MKGTINSLTDIVLNEESAPIFYIDVMENKWFSGQVKVVDLSWYAPYKTYGDTIICCFAYAFFFWRVFVNLPNIINGVGGSFDAKGQIADIQNGSRPKKGGR